MIQGNTLWRWMIVGLFLFHWFEYFYPKKIKPRVAFIGLHSLEKVETKYYGVYAGRLFIGATIEDDMYNLSKLSRL